MLRRLVHVLPLLPLALLAGCDGPAPQASSAAAAVEHPAPGSDLETVDQMLARTRNRFIALDLNHDGQLTRDELARDTGADSLKTLDADANGVVTQAEAEAQTRARFKRTDSNSDGKVSPDEIIAAFKRRGDQPPR